MRPVKIWSFPSLSLLTVGLLSALSLQLVSGCARPDWFVGVGGKYNQAKEEIARRRGGNIDKAIQNLEAIVQKDPTYRDSLTLLGRAYYKRERYNDARLILQRSLVVNSSDEIAWIVLGLTQLRLGEDEKGLEAVKGGITLLNKQSTDGYRGHANWDRAGKVRVSIRRAIVVALKGLEEKENLLRSVEAILATMDEEEFHQRVEKVYDHVQE